jgi:hypothetical protein
MIGIKQQTVTTLSQNGKTLEDWGLSRGFFISPRGSSCRRWSWFRDSDGTRWRVIFLYWKSTSNYRFLHCFRHIFALLEFKSCFVLMCNPVSFSCSSWHVNTKRYQIPICLFTYCDVWAVYTNRHLVTLNKFFIFKSKHSQWTEWT